MTTIAYTVNSIKLPKRSGIIKPDAGGWYEMCIGGFDFPNAGGVIYDGARAARHFQSNSDLMRRLEDQNLRGEDGHPRPYGLSKQEFLARAHDIFEPNVCVYWGDLKLDPHYGRNNPELGFPNMIGIIARFRPGGALGHTLERDLADEHTNVNFSIRAFSKPYKIGSQWYYEIDEIVTFDKVNEPGLFMAKKSLQPTMESRAPTFTMSRDITQEDVIAMMDTVKADGLTMESHNPMMARIAAQFTVNTGISRPVSILSNWK